MCADLCVVCRAAALSTAEGSSARTPSAAGWFALWAAAPSTRQPTRQDTRLRVRMADPLACVYDCERTTVRAPVILESRVVERSGAAVSSQLTRVLRGSHDTAKAPRQRNRLGPCHTDRARRRPSSCYSFQPGLCSISAARIEAW